MIITDKYEIENAMRRIEDKDPVEFLKSEDSKFWITKPSKIIFLDFDGVLNNQSFLINCGTREDAGLKRNTVEWHAHHIDTAKVDLLNEIIEKTGSFVIVSSAWRCGCSVSYLQALLDCKGFKGRIVGKTPDKGFGQRRSNEIKEVLNKLGRLISSFVVIDDDHYSEIKDHFVLTKIETGLTKKHVRKAIEILGGNG